MVKAAIIGGAGYTAGELIRILLNHPEVQLTEIVSNSNPGQPISKIHADLLGQTSLSFSDTITETPDVVFLSNGHGKSSEYLKVNPVPLATKVIDLSQDFRLKKGADAGNRHFVYGLPEVNKKKIAKADSIANPGCFATTIQEALLPLAFQHELQHDIHVHGITGATGAGQGLSATTHFTWRDNNISIYKPFHHQHLLEVNETLSGLDSGKQWEINFIPVRGNFSRGIFLTAYMKTDLSLKQVQDLYRDYYDGQPFIHLSDQPISLKQVINTNNCILHLEKNEDKLLITAVIDNLLKGASGQAVQNMNLLCGFNESLGLQFKGSMF